MADGNATTLSYHGYRFPPDIISHAVWLYHRFGVSFRDVEDLLAQRGIERCPTKRSGCGASRSVQYTLAGSSVDRAGWATSGTWTRSSSTIHGLPALSLARALPIKMVTSSRVLRPVASPDCRAATRFFRKLLKGQERPPGRLVTDKLSSYRAAQPSGHAVRRPSHGPIREQWRPKSLHQPDTATRRDKCAALKSPGQAQRFLSVHGLVRNLFRVGRHLVRAEHHRELRGRSLFSFGMQARSRRLTRTEITIPSTGSLDKR